MYANEITLMNGQKVDSKQIEIELLPNGTNDHLIKCFCRMCNVAYTERPLICKCRANVFLINIENGQIINN